MRVFFPIFAAALFILVFGTIEMLLLRRLNRVWWQNSRIRRAAIALPTAGIVTIIIWSIGEYHKIVWLLYPGGIATALVVVLEFGLMVSLPISGLIHSTNRHLDRRAARKRPEETGSIDTRRRLFLRGAAAAVPLVALATSARGLSRALGPVRVYLRPMQIAGLPSALEGFRILHLSDLHLWHYTNLGTLTQILEDARALHPHLVLLTGDVADDLTLLPEALRMVAALGAPSGAYGSLGNHEHFRGIPEVTRMYSQSTVPLLVNTGVTVPVSGAQVFIGAVDDPIRVGTHHEAFYRDALTKALGSAESADLTILMSHRPYAFDVAAARGVDLTLAGHTHGGQIGLMGRSLFESYMGDMYLWGEYAIGDSRLYTSSGAGHWFPFRLGCPTEAPVIELHRVVSATQSAA